MSADGFAAQDVVLERSLDCRYLGQSYEIDVPFRKARGARRAFLEAFHARHEKLYSYRHDRRPVEIVNLRVKAAAITPRSPWSRSGVHCPRSSGHPPETVHLLRAPGSRRRGRRQVAASPGEPPPRAGPRHRSRVDHVPSPGYGARVDAYANLVVRKGNAR